MIDLLEEIATKGVDKEKEVETDFISLSEPNP